MEVRLASPTIKQIQVGDRTHYRFAVDVGADPVTGKRRQLTRTFDRGKDAQAELARILHEVNGGRSPSGLRPPWLSISASGCGRLSGGHAVRRVRRRGETP